MGNIIKHIEDSTVLPLEDEVSYMPGQIVSKTLAQNEHRSLTLFAFDKGEEISTHDSEGDALVMVLDGEGRITIDGEEYYVKAGESILMPATIPHAVFAVTPFKMFLIVAFK